MKALEARWGSRTAAKLELAHGMIREAEAKWPGPDELPERHRPRVGSAADPEAGGRVAAEGRSAAEIPHNPPVLVMGGSFISLIWLMEEPAIVKIRKSDCEWEWPQR